MSADEDVYALGAVEDRLALELRHTAAHPDAKIGVGSLARAQPAEGVKELLGSSLAYRTGVEENEVGLLGRSRGHVALRLEDADDLLGVVDVHLATKRLDEEPILFFIDQEIGLRSYCFD